MNPMPHHADLIDVVGIARTDGYVEVVDPNGTGILVVTPEVGAEYEVDGWIDVTPV